MNRTKTNWKIVKQIEQNAIGVDCTEHFRIENVVMEEIAKVRKTRHSKYNINYHIVWIPKTRAKILNRPFDKDLEEAIRLKCKKRKWHLLAMQIMPDHVHLFVSAEPKWAPAKIVQELKGFTAWLLRKKYATLRMFREKELWTSSYYCGTAGHVSQEQVVRYIMEQTKHHHVKHKDSKQTTLCRFTA